MIETARRSDVDELSSQVEAMIRKLWRNHFQEFCPADTWSPAINQYQLARRLEVCVDLAGVDPASIHVRVERGAMTIRGVRIAPEPQVQPNEVMKIISMEINYGPFCRTISLPEHVDLRRVQTQYTRGLLWIRMALREPG